uniref:Odorant-binding protein n=1 Tax=Anoplophora chinensis TaxID=217632 RepID=A0A2H4ZB27_ANOCN|nr:odorant-binding protein [Anoplophora chinensis]
MKFLVVLACFIVLSSSLDQDFKEKFMQQMEEYGTKCIDEVHATDADIAELVAHKVPPTSHEAKCLIFCIHKSFKMMTEDGNPNTEGVLQLMAPLKETDSDIYEKFLKIAEKCSNSLEKDDDHCVTASNWAACGINEAKAMGMPDDLFQM